MTLHLGCLTRFAGVSSTAIYRNVAYIQTAATFVCRGKLSCLDTNVDAFQHQHFQQHKFELCATFFDTALELLGLCAPNGV